jgi:hypothetical protein
LSSSQAENVEAPSQLRPGGSQKDRPREEFLQDSTSAEGLARRALPARRESHCGIVKRFREQEPQADDELH